MCEKCACVLHVHKTRVLTRGKHDLNAKQTRLLETRLTFSLAVRGLYVLLIFTSTAVYLSWFIDEEMVDLHRPKVGEKDQLLPRNRTTQDQCWNASALTTKPPLPDK